MAKILVIDDEPSIRRLLATMLERNGHKVVLAEDGTGGLTLFRQERPNLIVLDLKMPQTDGIAVLQDIRAADTEIPVVILTGAGNEITKRQARELGAAAFIEKKSPQHLEQTVKRLLQFA